MNKRNRYQTKNRAYTSGRMIAVKGAVLHSYGCPQPDPKILAERWDSAGASACVHAHIGRDEVIVTLPCERIPERQPEAGIPDPAVKDPQTIPICPQR